MQQDKSTHTEEIANVTPVKSNLYTNHLFRVDCFCWHNNICIMNVWMVEKSVNGINNNDDVV